MWYFYDRKCSYQITDGIADVKQNIGIVEQGPELADVKVHRVRTYPLGAGSINIAAERRAREHVRRLGPTVVYEVSQFIDKTFKSQPNSALTTRSGFTEKEWADIMEDARTANERLNKALVAGTAEMLKYTTGQSTLLLTGGGSKSVSLQAKIKDTFPDAFCKMYTDGYRYAFGLFYDMHR